MPFWGVGFNLSTFGHFVQGSTYFVHVFWVMGLGLGGGGVRDPTVSLHVFQCKLSLLYKLCNQYVDINDNLVYAATFTLSSLPTSPWCACCVHAQNHFFHFMDKGKPYRIGIKYLQAIKASTLYAHAT